MQLPNQKGSVLTFLLIGIFVIAVVGGIFYLRWSTKTKPPLTSQATPIPSPSTDEIVDWKVYTNPKYQLTFKYPPNISLNENTTISSLTIYLGDFSLIVMGKDYDNSYIGISRFEYEDALK